MASPSVTLVRRGLAFNVDQDSLLRAVRDALSARIGVASYSAAVMYGLTLAAAHLGIEAPPPVPLAPTAASDRDPQPPPPTKPR